VNKTVLDDAGVQKEHQTHKIDRPPTSNVPTDDPHPKATPSPNDCGCALTGKQHRLIVVPGRKTSNS
jgi:hypothetical protein